MYSAMLDPGQHVVHELSQGRRAWLHIVEGEVTLGDVVLTAGDGAGFTAECSSPTPFATVLVLATASCRSRATSPRNRINSVSNCCTNGPA